LETELRTVAADAVLRAPKCFQVWLHRRRVLERLLLSLLPRGHCSDVTRREGERGGGGGGGEGEGGGGGGGAAAAAVMMLRRELEWSWAHLTREREGERPAADAKNMHAWSHRRWVLERALAEVEGDWEVRGGVGWRVIQCVGVD
jgi:hypothetical protein